MQQLQIENLTKTYRNGVKALDNVNLNISAGMFGLLGPNGAGKSTLMRTLATLQAPDAGRVLFAGDDILQHPQTLRKQLGYLPQDFGVYPGVSALDLLHHLAVLKGLLNKKERTEQITALLQQTNLYEARKKSVSTFSGGMRQRFGIAQALLGNPQLIIVDEPTAGLDPEERNRFHNLLSEIGENVVVILSTHIVEDVKELCSNMAIMANGRVIQQGKPIELMAELRGKVWKKTIEKRDLEGYKKQFTVLSTRLFSGKMQLHAWAEQCPQEGFEPLLPDLEDVYFAALSGAQAVGKESSVC